jgi:AraC-like DNA-binding protein
MLRLENVIYDDNIPNWRRSRIKSMRYVIIFVVQGTFQFQLDDFETELTKGDILYVRPGPYRSGTNGPHPPHQKYVAHFQLDPSSLLLASPHADEKGYELFKTNRAEYYRQRFHVLHQAWIDKSAYHEFVCHGLISEIYGSLLQELERKNVSSYKLKIARQIEKHIQEHYKEDIKLGQLCELVQLSPNYVIHIFKEVFNQTPLGYIHQLRISVAHDLLLQSDMAIHEISSYLGFCDPTYFNRVFRKLTGMPPSLLRKEKRAEAATGTRDSGTRAN